LKTSNTRKYINFTFARVCMCLCLFVSVTRCKQQQVVEMEAKQPNRAYE